MSDEDIRIASGLIDDNARRLSADLDRIEARSRARAAVDLTLAHLPSLDERPMSEQIEDGLAQMRRALELFEDADDVVDILRLYALTWSHRYGPSWHETTEAYSLLGRYRAGHPVRLAGRRVSAELEAQLALEHTRSYYLGDDMLEAHLTIDHGFDDAASWPNGRRLAAHAAVHHVLPTRAEA
jgi:hypothetical protein